MSSSGQLYLEALAGFPAKTFEKRFSRIALRLGLGGKMNGEELHRLFEAAFSACLCNLALNGGAAGEPRPDRERTRLALERRFMAARGHLLKCPRWRKLDPSVQAGIRRLLLTVRVTPENLAPEP